MKQHFLHRRGKTLLCMFIIIPLLFNIAIVRIGVASPNQTKVYVDPPSILNTTLVPGKNFTINVNVSNVTNLYGYEIHLYYNTTILDGLSVELPPGHFLTPVDPTKIFIMALEINDAYNATHGRVLATVMLFWPEPVKNGSGTLITVTFEVTGIGECSLDLNPAKLGDPDGNPIEHEDVDGYFNNLPPGHDVAVININTRSVIYPNFNVSIIVTIKNDGSFIEKVNLTLKYDGIFIGNETLNLVTGESLDVLFTWNTTGIPYGNYILNATATVLNSISNPGGIDDDPADNTLKVPFVVTMAGDVDGDFDIDPDDFYFFAGAYGTSPPSNPLCDLDDDGDIDPDDFYLFSGKYGWSYP